MWRRGVARGGLDDHAVAVGDLRRDRDGADDGLARRRLPAGSDRNRIPGIGHILTEYGGQSPEYTAIKAAVRAVTPQMFRAPLDEQIVTAREAMEDACSER
jgi:hypothetical protein